ncbi:MAG: hypothetical protein B7Z38_04145 [Rhodobacterales bacterium 12-64-8]|nr:MAG: hypothetical protein B7Z38_04145 [Rhodobacterales bacterium 12-64-8]OYX45085.1 MAG: hypothetical protein B7Y90_18930 [Alphaproteobacteria bacterium 32-64-14]
MEHAQVGVAGRGRGGGGSGRLTERTVEFGERGAMVWRDPQIDEPVAMVRTDMFTDCAALRAHQGQ